MTDFFMNVVGDKYWKAPGGWENLQNVFGEVGGGLPNSDELKKRAFWTKLLNDSPDVAMLGSANFGGASEEAGRWSGRFATMAAATLCVAVGFFAGRRHSENRRHKYTVIGEY